MVLRDLSWFCLICDGSAWSEWVLSYLWFFCAIWASSALLVMALCYLSRFCIIYDGSVWSELVLRDLDCFCVICDGFVRSVLVLCYLGWFCVIGTGSAWSEWIQSNLCSVWSELVLCDLSRSCVIFEYSVCFELVLLDLWWSCVIWAFFFHVKFDEKCSGDVTEHVWPTILELWPDFV